MPDRAIQPLTDSADEQARSDVDDGHEHHRTTPQPARPCPRPEPQTTTNVQEEPATRARPIEPLTEELPADWQFPAAKLYRWLALGRRVDEMLERMRPPDTASGEWRFGWDACLEAIMDGFLTEQLDGVPSRDDALRLLHNLAAELNEERGLNTRTLGANLRLVAQLLADEIERRDAE
jgi:hypothetical protein